MNRQFKLFFWIAVVGSVVCVLIGLLGFVYGRPRLAIPAGYVIVLDIVVFGSIYLVERRKRAQGRSL